MKPIPAPQLVVDPNPAINWTFLLAGGLLVLALALYLSLGRGQASADFRAGLILGLRGLLGKELRSRSRGWRPMWLLTGYLAGLALAVAGVLALMSRVGGVVSTTAGTQLFSTLALGSVVLLAFITPALTVGAVSGERERRTLDLLLVTRASPLGLVSGKLLGSLFYILFLLVASLPAFALVYLFGGVPPLYLAMVVAVAAVTGVAHAALGLLLSAVLKRTIVASVVAYLVVVFLVFGLPFLSAVTFVAQQARSGPAAAASQPLLLYASPTTSLASVLPGGSAGIGMPLIGDLMRFALMSSSSGYGIAQPTSISVARSIYVTGTNPATGEPQTALGWAAWVYHFLFSGALTLASLLISALWLAPVKPWQRLRLSRR